MKKLIFSLLFFLLTLYSGGVLKAAESNDKLLEGSSGVLYVNNVIAEKITDDKYSVKFDIQSSGLNKLNLHYNIALVKADGSGSVYVFYTQYYDEIVNIFDGDKKSFKTDFSFPEFLDGKYRFAVSFGGVNNVVSAGVSNDEYSFSGTGAYITFEDCKLKIENDSRDYNLTEGAFFESGKKNYLICNINNKTSNDVSFTIRKDLFRRSDYGVFIKTEDDSIVYSVTGGEKKNLELLINTTDLDPQAYSYRVSAISDNKIVSSDFFVHFIVPGLSATILDLSIDKDSYKNGDTANVSFNIVGRADDFGGSKAGNITVENTKIQITISDGNGVNCASEEYKIDVLGRNSYVNNVKTSIIKDCQNPIVTANLYDSSGRQLDSFKVNVKSKIIDDIGKADNIPKEIGKDTSDYFLVYILIFVVICLVVFVVVLRLKGKNGKK